MPGAAWLPPHRLGALSESSAKLVASATDRFVRDHDATLEQQLLDVTQAQAEPEGSMTLREAGAGPPWGN
jgi:hypothetical protein